MKKILTLTFTIMMILSMTACGDSSSQSNSEKPQSENQQAQENTSQPTDTSSSQANSHKKVDINDFQANSGDAEHMKSATEDYFLHEITVDVDGLLFEQKLHSYDQKGNCILVCYKSVYESEAIAKKQYDDRKKFDNDNSVLQGNVLYSSNEGHCTQKKSEDWENYLWWVDSDVEHEKLYFSKPITNNESSLPADTAASTSESAAPPAPETSVGESQGNTASNDGNIYADKLKFAVDTTITEQDIKRLKATTDDYCTSVAVIDGLEELIITSFDKDGKVVNIDMRSQCENADKTKECFDGTYYDYIDNSLKKAIDNYVYISGFKDGLNKSDYLGFAQSGDNGAYYFSKN